MTATTNAENYENMKLHFLLEHILAFASSPNMAREVKNLSPNFK